MTVRLDATDPDAAVTLRLPNGQVRSGRFVEATIAPTDAGEYGICVTPGDQPSEYQLFVSVIDDNSPDRVSALWCGERVNDRGEIRFATGASSDRFGDSVIRGERDLYRLDAAAGQSITAEIESLEDNASFLLRGPGGETLVVDAEDFTLALPTTGTYQLCVGSTRGNATYTVDLSID